MKNPHPSFGIVHPDENIISFWHAKNKKPLKASLRTAQHEHRLYLSVRAGVGDDQEARLAELLGDLVGEGTGGEASGDRQAAGVLGKLEHRALAVGAGGDGHHVLSHQTRTP